MKKLFPESERAPEMRQKHRKSLPNGRQQEPQGGGAKRRPLGAAPKAPPCCLPFGKDFLCFWCISGALLGLHGPSPLRKLRHRSAPHAYSGTYSNRRCELKKTAFIFFNSWGGGPNLGRWAERTSPAHMNKKKTEHVALEPVPAPQLGRFLFDCFFIRILLGKWRWS